MFCFVFFAISRQISNDLIIDHGYNAEFFFHNTGYNNQIEGEDLNIIPAWSAGYDGKNHNITVVGGGCRLSNHDFNNTADFQNSYNYITKTSDPFTSTQKSQLGTAILGLAAANINNFGIVGAAPESSVSCIAFDTAQKLIKDTEMEKYLFEKTKHADVLAIPFLMMGPKPYLPNTAIQEKMKEAATKNNLVIVNSAGNSGHLGGDVNHYAATCSPHAITVGSSTVRGSATYYTNNGACISVTSPNSGLPDEFPIEMARYPMIPHPSSDDDELLDVSHGDNRHAVGPIAGIAALLRNANPNLTPYDIQVILELTATRNDPNSPLWKQNAAGNYYHPQLGFGRANAALAADVAKQWTNKLTPSTSEKSFTNSKGNYISYGSSSPTEIEFSISSNINFVSYVELQINTSNVDLNMAKIEVQSPQGSRFTVLYPSIFQEDSDDFIINVKQSFKSKMTIGIRCFLGEKAAGTWRVFIKYSNYYPEVTLYDSKLIIYGFESVTIPTFTKAVGKESELKYALLNSTSWIEMSSHSVECDKDTHLHLSTFTENYEDIPVPLYLVNKKDSSHVLIGSHSTSYKPSNITIRVPCIYKSGDYGLSFRYDNTIFQVSHDIKLNNHHDVMLFKPKPHTIIKENPLFVVWNRNLTRPKPSGIYQKVIINIYDNNKDKHLLTKYIDESGDTNVNVPKVNCEDCIFSISSVYDEENLNYFSTDIYLRLGDPTSPTPSPYVPTRTVSQLHSGTQFLITSAVGSIIVSLLVALAMFLRKRRKAENATAYITPLLH